MGQPHKTASHLAWNFIGFGFTAASGFLVNFLVARYSTPAALGVFNQAFAAYIIMSQVAVSGVHLSVLKTVSENSTDRQRVGAQLMSAQWLVLPLGLVASIVMFAGADLAARLADSGGLSVAFRWAAPGVLLFALNKTMISAINGMSALRLVAFLQALRPIAMIGWIIWLLMSGGRSDLFAGALTFAEALVLIVAFAGLRHLKVPLRPREELAQLVKAHWHFGMRATPGAVLGELNTRIDVIVLGWFLPDNDVGIYSFAALIAEGLFQLGIVIRTVFNPRLAAYFAKGETPRLLELIRLIRSRTYLAFLILCPLVAVAFPLLVKVLGGNASYLAGQGAFIVLAIALTLVAGYIPLSQLLIQVGRPHANSVMVAASAAVNLGLNILLIPILGLEGSAIGTGAAWLTQTAYLVWYSRTNLALKI